MSIFLFDNVLHKFTFPQQKFIQYLREIFGKIIYLFIVKYSFYSNNKLFNKIPIFGKSTTFRDHMTKYGQTTG